MPIELIGIYSFVISFPALNTLILLVPLFFTPAFSIYTPDSFQACLSLRSYYVTVSVYFCKHFATEPYSKMQSRLMPRSAFSFSVLYIFPETA